MLSTGNKSEIAVGYCTLYGDMAGGYALLSDVPKTLVYELAREINRDAERIPQSSIEKEPSAELAPDQKDSDSLPPYAELDPLIEALVDLALPWPEAARRAGVSGAVARRHRGADRRQRVQAPPDAAGPEGHRQGLRRRATLPDRAEVRHLRAAIERDRPRSTSGRRSRLLARRAAPADPRARRRAGACSTWAPPAATWDAPCATAARFWRASSRTPPCPPPRAAGTTTGVRPTRSRRDAGPSPSTSSSARTCSSICPSPSGCSSRIAQWLAPDGTPSGVAAQRRQRHGAAGAPGRPLPLRRARDPRPDAPAFLHARDGPGAPRAGGIPRRGDRGDGHALRARAAGARAPALERRSARLLERPARGCSRPLFGYQFVFEAVRGRRRLEPRGRQGGARSCRPTTSATASRLPCAAIADWVRSRPGGWDWEVHPRRRRLLRRDARARRSASAAEAGLPLTVLAPREEPGQGRRHPHRSPGDRGGPDPGLGRRPLDAAFRMGQARRAASDASHRDRLARARARTSSAASSPSTASCSGGRATSSFASSPCPESATRSAASSSSAATSPGGSSRRARIDRFAYDMEILYLARREGIAIAEVPVLWFNSPDSRVSLVRDAIVTLRDLLRIRWIHRKA